MKYSIVLCLLLVCVLCFYSVSSSSVHVNVDVEVSDSHHHAAHHEHHEHAGKPHNHRDLSEEELDEILDQLDETEASSELDDADGFYADYIKIDDGIHIPIWAPHNVIPEALTQAETIMKGMTPAGVSSWFRSHGYKIVIMKPDQAIPDFPENAYMKKIKSFDGRDFKNIRGCGATTMTKTTMIGEESLVRLPESVYWNENIFVHEYGHTIELGLQYTNPSLFRRIGESYNNAIRNSIQYKTNYAGSNHMEYFAEMTQSWLFAQTRKDTNNNVWCRNLVKEKDPNIAAAMEQVYGEKYSFCPNNQVSFCSDALLCSDLLSQSGEASNNGGHRDPPHSEFCIYSVLQQIAQAQEKRNNRPKPKSRQPTHKKPTK